MNEAIRMQLSAFVDGELPDNEKELLLRRLSQDEELRRELARHLAIGRAMRGELQPAGTDSLRERINAAIDSGEDLGLPDEDAVATDRRIRPLAGFAIAASVALAAIIGLQQFGTVDPVSGEIPGVEVTAENTGITGITEPTMDDLLEQLRQRHEANGPENNIRTVLTSIEIGREAIEEQQVDAEEALPTEAEDTAGDESTTEPLVE